MNNVIYFIFNNILLGYISYIYIYICVCVCVCMCVCYIESYREQYKKLVEIANTILETY